MFASTSLATRIERAEMRLTQSMITAIERDTPDAFAMPIAGGVAAYAGPSSPMSKMIGVGWDGVPDDASLGAVEERFRACRAALQAEVSTLANPAIATHLTQRGYALVNFENVSGRALGPLDQDIPLTPGLRIDAMTETNATAWIDAAITGFQHPDSRGVQADALPPREMLEAALRPWTRVAGFRRYCAWIGGALAGIATLRIDDGVAQLCGAATLPSFRKRGVQSALLRRRLADGAAAKCDVAVVTTQPGSSSQENVHRAGFSLLYARAILVKEA